MYQYEGVDWLIAKEYAPLPEGGFKRMGADVLRLRIPSVHPEFLALASPFLLHSVMTNGDALEEWLEVHDDGRYVLDCVIKREPADHEDFLKMACKFVRRETIYPGLRILNRVPGRKEMALLYTAPNLMPAHGRGEAVHPQVAGALPLGWLAHLAGSCTTAGDPVFYRLTTARIMHSLVVEVNTSTKCDAVSDAFLLAARRGAKEEERLVLHCEGKPSAFVSAVLRVRPRALAAHAARAIREELERKQRYGVRGATLLISNYIYNTAPLVRDEALRRLFLDQLVIYKARVLPSAGTVLRLGFIPLSLPDGLRFRPSSFADAISTAERERAERDASVHPNAVHIVLSADPVAGADFNTLSGDYPRLRFTHTYITDAHFLSVQQLRGIVAKLPGPPQDITLYGCPLLAPLADAGVLGARGVVSAVRELPVTAPISHAAPAEALTPVHWGPAAGDTVPVSSPAHLFSLCMKRMVRFTAQLPPIGALALDELYAYAYLFHRFSALTGSINSGELCAAVSTRRPPSYEYTSEADYDSALQ